MSDNREAVIKHIQEMNAKRKVKSLEELRKRMIGEKKIREILKELKLINISYDEILFNSTEINKPDMTLNDLDISIPIFIRTNFDNKLMNLENIKKIYVEQDYKYVIIVWIDEDILPAILLTVEDIKYYIVNPIFTSNRKPLKTLITEVFNKERLKLNISNIEITETFDFSNFNEKFIDFCKYNVENELDNKTPKINYKKDALKNINQGYIEVLLKKIIEFYKGDIKEEEIIEYIDKVNMGGFS